jgi:flagellar motor switch protein FliG
MPRKPGDKLPDDPTQLEGLTKSAILLLTLDPQTAGTMLKVMPPEQVEEVTRELAGLGRVSDALREAVVAEFYGMSMASQYASEGGLEYAKILLGKSLDGKTAEKVLAQIQTQVQKTPFAFLQKAESENLLTFIQDEHPQTIALILCHLAHHKAAEILAGLPLQKQIEVIKRVANMEQTNPEVIKEVERGLESRLSSMLMQSMEKAGGVPTVAEILNLADRSTEKSVMEGLEADDPELVEQIRRLMFVFEDIKLVDDKGIQMILKEVDNDELALGLKTASDDLKNKIFKNMSERAATLIKEDMQFMGPVRVSDVEASQQKIVDIVRRLEDSGEIIIAGRGGGGEELVV